MNTDTAPASLPTPATARTDLAQLSDDELIGLVGKSWINFKETASAVLVEYQRRGKTPADLGRNLAAAGWKGSPRTVHSLAADLRQQGLLPATNRGRKAAAIADPAIQGDTGSPAIAEPVPNLEEQEVVENHKLTAVLAGPEGPRSHSEVYLRVGNVMDEGYRDLVFNGKELHWEERISLRNFLGGCLQELGVSLQEVNQLLAAYQGR